MSKETISTIVVDIGTSYMKCAVISHTTINPGYITRFKVSLPLYMKPESEPDVQGWFLLLVYWLRNLDNDTLQNIAAIVVCGQSPALVAIDNVGSIVKPILLRNLLHETTYGVIGQEAESYFIPLAFWYKQHYPLQYKRIERFLPIPEYIVYRLCGKSAAIYPNRKYREFYWDRRTLKGAGLDTDKFPPLLPMGTKIGILSEDIAQFTNLKSGIPLFGGGLDFAMALIGTNTLRVGRVCDSAGYSEGINYCGNTDVKHILIQSMPHIINRHWNNSLIIESSGLIYERAIQRLKVENQKMFPPHATGGAPYIPRLFHTGYIEYVSNNQKPGIDPQIRLSLLVESLFFTLRFFLEEIQRTSQGTIQEIRLCGGQAYYNVWNQIKSNYIGIECIQMEDHNSELIGGAICALYGLGIYSSMAKAAERVQESEVRYSPDLDIFVQTQDRYQEFRERFTNYLAVRASRH